MMQQLIGTRRGRRSLSRLLPGVASAVVMLTWGGMPQAAWGHGVVIQSQTREVIEIVATFDTGEPMANAQVLVYAPSDPQTPRFTDQTDSQGRYILTPDEAGTWEVAIRQAGHGEIAALTVSEEGALVNRYRSTSPLSPLQRGLMAGAVTWGCVGTALYFRQGQFRRSKD